MKTTLLFLAVLPTAVAFAATAPSNSETPPPPLPPPTAQFPDQQPTPLDDKDKAALALASEWKEAPSMPAPGANGKVTFTFGATLPSVICSPIEVTDIELEPGETVKEGGLHCGDSLRWNISPAVSGPEGASVTHLVIKPTTGGITTSILCATDRRVYHIKLVASANDWMPYVGFSYPENARVAWMAYQKKQQRAHDDSIVGDSGHTLNELDFDYTIEGSASWAPVRVYNDGVKTIIQMPEAMAQTEAPALLVIGADKKEQLVNYRVRGDKYIVDQIFGKAELISGVGHRQVKVIITRGVIDPDNQKKLHVGRTS
jgi:type IV secretion system protein VirB9